MLTLNDDAPVAIGSQALTFTFFVPYSDVERSPLPRLRKK